MKKLYNARCIYAWLTKTARKYKLRVSVCVLIALLFTMYPILNYGSNSSKYRSAKVSSSSITSAARGVIGSFSWKYEEHRPVCNFSVRDVFFTVFRSYELSNMRANEMCKHWAQNSSRWELISIRDAQRYANEGYFVVSCYINPNPHKSGHVAVVVPGRETYSRSWRMYVPTILNAGERNRYTFMPLSHGYGADKKNQVKFYRCKYIRE